MDAGTIVSIAISVCAVVVGGLGLMHSRRDRGETTAAEFAALRERVSASEKNLEGLRDWKHLTVDPYIPRAVDDHHRRLDRIESKVFNGHGVPR